MAISAFSQSGKSFARQMFVCTLVPKAFFSPSRYRSVQIPVQNSLLYSCRLFLLAFFLPAGFRFAGLSLLFLIISRHSSAGEPFGHQHVFGIL
jgi:hypothetical protein